MPFTIPFHPSYDWGMDNVIRSPVKRRLGKPKGRHPHKRLSTAFVRSAPPGRHCDGNGLYLYVQKTGTRSWIQRLVIRGRKRELGLGNAQLVLLAEAREQALANRKLARAGGDPLAEKRRSAGIPTFAEAAKRVIEQKSAGWRNAAVPRNWYRSFEIHVFPRIGRVPVSEMTSADVLEILTPIWHANPPTARIVRHRIRAVLEWAIAMDWRTDNPCDRLLPVLGSQQHVVRHRKALPHREVGAAIEKVRAAKAGKVDALAFEFMVLTAARGRRGPRGGMERDRPGGARLDGPREPDEEPARAPCAAVRPRAGDSRRGAEAGRRWESDRVRRQARQRDGRRADGPAAQEARDRGGAAWVQVVVQGLGRRRDGPPPRSRRGGPGPCSPEPGRGRLHALRPVRAPPSAHGRLGCLPQRGTDLLAEKLQTRSILTLHLVSLQGVRSYLTQPHLRDRLRIILTVVPAQLAPAGEPFVTREPLHCLTLRHPVVLSW